MRRNPHKKYITIGIETIVDDSRKDSVRINLGQKVNVWFPRAAIEIDPFNYSITGEESVIREKLREAQGWGSKAKAP